MHTVTSVEIHPDPDFSYSFKVSIGEEYSISYVEDGKTKTVICFGSMKEMETVAKKMLQLVELHKA